MVAQLKEKVMYIRKKNSKWQCVVRVQGIAKAQSFVSKADARKWGNRQEAQIRLGTYSDESRLTNLRLRDLLKLYFDKAVKVSRRAKTLKYEVDLLCRFPISSNTLNTLTAVKLSNFRDDRLKDGRSTTTVGKYLKLISRAIVVGQKEFGISITNNPVDLVDTIVQAPLVLGFFSKANVRFLAPVPVTFVNVYLYLSTSTFEDVSINLNKLGVATSYTTSPISVT